MRTRVHLCRLDLLLQVHAAGAHSFDDLEPDDLEVDELDGDDEDDVRLVPGSVNLRKGLGVKPPIEPKFATSRSVVLEKRPLQNR